MQGKGAHQMKDAGTFLLTKILLTQVNKTFEYTDGTVDDSRYKIVTISIPAWHRLDIFGG
jgi:hypothetical protein